MSLYGEKRVSVETGKSDRVQQNQKKDCDVNVIVDRARRGLGVGVVKQGAYLDVSSVGSLADAFIRVQVAQHSFNSLPAKVRARFRNNVPELIRFVEDPANREEAIKLGLIEEVKNVSSGNGAQASGSPAPAGTSSVSAEQKPAAGG